MVKLDYKDAQPIAEPFKVFASAGFPRFFIFKNGQLLGSNYEYREEEKIKEILEKFNTDPENKIDKFGGKKHQLLWQRLGYLDTQIVQEKLLLGESNPAPDNIAKIFEEGKNKKY